MADRNTALIFAPSRTRTAARIARIIDQDLLSGRTDCTIFRDPVKLCRTLKHQAHRRCFAILLAADRRELESIAAMAPWFENLPLILMIPNHLRPTIALAHRLRPRYLVEPRIDFREMRLVLRRLVSCAISPDRNSTRLHPQTLMTTLRKKGLFLVRQGLPRGEKQILSTNAMAGAGVSRSKRFRRPHLHPRALGPNHRKGSIGGPLNLKAT
ncbi:MAG: hypothetical protein M0036_09320 [Desulfobacteraceae bacterium]|nr:hypothetical protein [Desulfobacteraceae bacterium]